MLNETFHPMLFTVFDYHNEVMQMKDIKGGKKTLILLRQKTSVETNVNKTRQLKRKKLHAKSFKK